MKQKRLGDIATYINGYAFKPEDRGTEGLPIIRIQDLTGNAYNLGFYNGTYPERIEINNGDVLISWSASLGVYIWNRGKALLNQHIFKVVFDKVEVNKMYFVFAIQYNIKKMEAKTHGATMKHIVKKDFENTLVPFPSLEKQAKIAEVLSKVTRIIEVRQQELKKLDELVKGRFVEMFGDPTINSKNKDIQDLKDVLVLKAGDFTAASDISEEPTETNIYPCYGGNGIRGYVADYNQEGEYSLVGRQGALSGNVQYAEGKFRNTEHALLVTPIIEMNSIWLNQLLINLDLKRYQTGAAQPGLSVKNLQEIPIIMVSIDEQNRYADFVKQVDKSKAVVQQALDKAQLLFDSLMQEYFG
ncbi:MAG: restriction endonuclease subunit S [Lentihominibacter sp.]